MGFRFWCVAGSAVLWDLLPGSAAHASNGSHGPTQGLDDRTRLMGPDTPHMAVKLAGAEYLVFQNVQAFRHRKAMKPRRCARRAPARSPRAATPAPSWTASSSV
ncbi:hypothetical protein GCM10012286_16600 [Streptomyces lasiicapitis]|uniref:Uncharacterized protein n=1 Tax=Streptomyces lasiicapitis TaxID=1923961 RepID=A0ABQ2LLH6_9ACTN|nr:hypothetical protein GCM10012286_16600 [Streptomyces lasiicapitis]